MYPQKNSDWTAQSTKRYVPAPLGPRPSDKLSWRSFGRAEMNAARFHRFWKPVCNGFKFRAKSMTACHRSDLSVVFQVLRCCRIKPSSTVSALKNVWISSSLYAGLSIYSNARRKFKHCDLPFIAAQTSLRQLSTKCLIPGMYIEFGKSCPAKSIHARASFADAPAAAPSTWIPSQDCKGRTHSSVMANCPVTSALRASDSTFKCWIKSIFGVKARPASVPWSVQIATTDWQYVCKMCTLPPTSKRSWCSKAESLCRSFAHPSPRTTGDIMLKSWMVLFNEMSFCTAPLFTKASTCMTARLQDGKTFGSQSESQSWHLVCCICTIVTVTVYLFLNLYLLYIYGTREKTG